MCKPRFFVNYTKYTLFMSFLAHEYKRLGYLRFINKYKNKKYRGLRGRYLLSYINYLENSKNGLSINVDKVPKKVVLDPYTYTLYFKFKDKSVLKSSIDNAIPEFLVNGLVITEVQEAVKCMK